MLPSKTAYRIHPPLPLKTGQLNLTEDDLLCVHPPNRTESFPIRNVGSARRS